MEPPTLVWIRIGDLRFHDNPAISSAARKGKPVLLLYIDDSSSESVSTGRASLCWLEKSLELFAQKALSLGFLWLFRKGDSLSVIEEIVQLYSINHITWNRRYEEKLKTLDMSVYSFLKNQGRNIETFPGNVLIEPFYFLNKKSEPYQVFTHFWNALEPILPHYEEAPFYRPKQTHVTLSSASIPAQEIEKEWAKKILYHWKIGEDEALEQAELFAKKSIEEYPNGRDIPFEEMTSKLSPALHFGEISVRRLWNIIYNNSKKPAQSVYCRQLGWREFGIHHLFHFPKTPYEPFKKQFNKFPYRNDSEELQKWKKGRTGIPIVDAGMRELWETGWMHNRVRMIVGSYLVKHLLHSWKEGFDWFWDTLVDADLANNTMGWQWISGCGVDAAPYFRIFNPVLQGKKFDPDGKYVKKYLLELKNVPKEYIHDPWEAPELTRLSWGFSLGKEYPFPIVDLTYGRKRALEAFQSV